MATVLFASQAQSFEQFATGETAARVQPLDGPAPGQSIDQAFDQFTLAPLSAGDIIDRAVRLYRRHFLVFLRIVLPPSLIAYAGSILLALGMRNFSFERGDARLLLTLGLLGGGGVLWLAGKVLFLMLLGGASRALVKHFFDGEPLRARDAFRAVRERWKGLLGATLLVALLLVIALGLVYLVAAFGLFFYFLIAVWLMNGWPTWVQGLMHFLFGGALLAGGALLLLMVYARVVCVPQALMVEGIGAAAAITRSFRLARRELRRIAALVLFQFCVATSLYWLLIVPLGWYAYWNGVEVGLFSASASLWFNVAQQTLAQLGEILIAPVVLLGFTLLYLDTRVRKEGFDIELLANRVLPPAQYTPASAVPRDNAISWADTFAPVVAVAAPPPAETEFAEVVPLGAPVTKEEAKQFCRNCGTSAAVSQLFCTACGTRF